MDDVLPSYASAVEKNLWVLVAPYLWSRELYSAGLVSKEWNKTFISYLWGSPAKHFGSQSEGVYGKHTRSDHNIPSAAK